MRQQKGRKVDTKTGFSGIDWFLIFYVPFPLFEMRQDKKVER